MDFDIIKKGKGRHNIKYEDGLNCDVIFENGRLRIPINESSMACAARVAKDDDLKEKLKLLDDVDEED